MPGAHNRATRTPLPSITQMLEENRQKSQSTAFKEKEHDSSYTTRTRVALHSHQMQREAIVLHDDEEEHQVHKDVQQVRHQLQVEHVQSLRATTSTARWVVAEAYRTLGTRHTIRFIYADTFVGLTWQKSMLLLHLM